MEEFFIKLIIDALQWKCDELGYNDEQFDNMFIDTETGTYLDDVTFFKTKGITLCNEQLYQFVYSVIVDNYDNEEVPLEFDIKSIFTEIVTRFLIYNYGNKELTSVYSYLSKADNKTILDQFLNDYDFGIGLMNGIYTSIVYEDYYNKNKAKIIRDKKGSMITKFYDNITNDSISFNDFLRSVICDLYNYYISIGTDDIGALNCTWAFFTYDMDPIGVLDEICNDILSKGYIKKMMLNIMFSDLFEDALNKPIVDSENYDDRMADFIPVFCISMGFVNIPNDISVRNRLLKHFILLQDEDEKKKDNRANTYEHSNELYLKKVNPTYQVDDYKYMKM